MYHAETDRNTGFTGRHEAVIQFLMFTYTAKWWVILCRFAARAIPSDRNAFYMLATADQHPQIFDHEKIHQFNEFLLPKLFLIHLNKRGSSRVTEACFILFDPDVKQISFVIVQC